MMQSASQPRTTMTTMKCRRQPRGSDGASNVGTSSSAVSCSVFIVGSLLLAFFVQNQDVDQSFVHAFTSTPYRSASTSTFGAVGRGWVSTPATSTTSTTSTQIAAGDGEDSPPENPYADPNYPDLEFVNYDDPEYQVDQGVGDEFFDPESTEEQVEMMREERRVRNDEFQFETYYRDILKNGEEFKGEWMVYHTSTFTSDGDADADAVVDANGRPKLAKAAGPLKVISRGERIEIDTTADGSDIIKEDEGTETTNDTKRRLVKQRIIHHEKIFSDPDDAENKKKTVELLKQEQLSMDNKFWPEQLAYSDFRGHQGIMCVGSSYTICTAKQLNEDDDDDTQPSHVGPFKEYRVELGLLDDVLRFRIKVDYSILDKDAVTSSSSPPPALHLKSLTVCRETLGMWPRAEKYKSAIEAVTSDALWGPRGAAGGLYDPPPVGSAEQASQYLLLDLEGRATVLLPYLMDQDPDVHGPDSSGWVTSLDWTPGKNRFQADRKTNSGKDLMGLRTLELTEVESATAEMWRPRDGGENMRQ